MTGRCTSLSVPPTVRSLTGSPVANPVACRCGDLGYRRAVIVAIFAKPTTEIAPGAVHLPGWLSVDRQRQLVMACRYWAQAPAGMRPARLPNGSVMSVRTVCLGWHWYPYRYSRTVDDGGGSRVQQFPDWLGDLGRQAVADAYRDRQAGLGYRPDIALINYYDAAARMGMHQDRDERSTAPVVSLSLGDSCVFRFGNTQCRGRPWRDVVLESGDVVVFGGPSRFAFHGVPKTLPATGDRDIGLRGGRLNITLRESGLE
jgi:DNA oxidative demethylase